MEPERRTGVEPAVRNTNWTTIGLIAGLVLLVLVVAYFATNRNSDQDKLGNGAVATTGAAANEKACASKSTYDLIKRELFRRAAQVRGSDQGAYDRLSAYALLRMENPVMESEDAATRAINCSGSLAIDLPPGVAVVGGRRTLAADVDYSVQPAADGSGSVVLLRNADAIITPLATLARVNQPAAEPASPTVENEAADDEPDAPPAAPSRPTPPPPQPPPATTSIRPSFNCANARTSGERAVCSDAGLAALDRNMAAQYGRALSSVSSDQRELLRETRDRFLRFRDRCPNRQCIADAYTGRMREIRDIVEGRWQPPR